MKIAELQAPSSWSRGRHTERCAISYDFGRLRAAPPAFGATPTLRLPSAESTDAKRTLGRTDAFATLSRVVIVTLSSPSRSLAERYHSLSTAFARVHIPTDSLESWRSAVSRIPRFSFFFLRAISRRYDRNWTDFRRWEIFVRVFRGNSQEVRLGLGKVLDSRRA